MKREQSVFVQRKRVLKRSKILRCEAQRSQCQSSVLLKDMVQPSRTIFDCHVDVEQVGLVMYS